MRRERSQSARLAINVHVSLAVKKPLSPSTAFSAPEHVHPTINCGRYSPFLIDFPERGLGASGLILGGSVTGPKGSCEGGETVNELVERRWGGKPR